MTDKKIHEIRPNGTISKTTLVELGMDERLESFIIGCIWKDGTVTIGWPGGMSDATLALVTLSIEDTIKERIFP